MSALDHIESSLAEILSGEKGDSPASLNEAIAWAVEGGGKRIRPQMCLDAAVAAGGVAADAILPACAIELLHSYTLVHDDLPPMDNDLVRRGKPSVWAKFGEATAILAGDSLQALAFRTAARSPRNSSRIVAALAAAAVAVVNGQVADLESGKAAGAQPSAHCDYIFANKTAALFVAAAEMGALAAGGSDASIESLRSYAKNLGFAFQYEDDLLDAEDGAFSSVTLFGAEEVSRRVHAHTEAALSALAGLPGDSAPLAALATRLVGRFR